MRSIRSYHASGLLRTSLAILRNSTERPETPALPTRRSSDLRRRHQTPPRRASRGGQVQGCEEHARGLHRSEEHRLNSSHRCISYAVFCLKKKKGSQRNERLVTRIPRLECAQCA